MTLAKECKCIHIVLMGDIAASAYNNEIERGLPRWAGHLRHLESVKAECCV